VIAAGPLKGPAAEVGAVADVQRLGQAGDGPGALMSRSAIQAVLSQNACTDKGRLRFGTVVRGQDGSPLPCGSSRL
jgi:hypothetical protein